MTIRSERFAIALLLLGAALEGCSEAQTAAQVKKKTQAAAKTTSAQRAAQPLVPVYGARLRLIGATRATTLTDVGGGGFGVTVAAPGWEFIILKYQLSAPTPDELPILERAHLESAKGETYSESGNVPNPRSRYATEVEVVQVFSVPKGLRPKALSFSDPAPGSREPQFTAKGRVDLSRLTYLAKLE